MDNSKFSNPQNFQGIWFCIHLFAINCDSQEMKNSFINFINILIDNFKCNECKKHFKEYLSKYPLDESNLFKWSWEFHNKVNKFLEKKCPTYDEAYEYFSNSNSGLCLSTNCHNFEDTENDLKEYLKFLYLDERKNL